MVCDQSNRVIDSDQKSFDDVKRHWLPEVKNNADFDCEKLLLLNKMDLPQKDLDAAEVQAFAAQEGIMVYETSAKTGKNVNGVFIELCRKLIAKLHDVNKKRARNMTTDKSLFKSSTYDQQNDIKLTQHKNTQPAPENSFGKCCGNS